jgi:hypothetical protein
VYNSAVHNCIGFSTAGKREGLTNAGSSLFSHVKRLAKALRPPMLFLENVGAILCNKDIVEIVRALRALGYDMWWVVLPAYSVGAPQKRSRWFCLCVQRGTTKIALKPTEPYSRHNWASESVPRMIPKSSSEQRRRMRAMGNSVVPDCVRAAFLSLFTGDRIPVPTLLKQSTKGGPTLTLNPPAPLGPAGDSTTFAMVASPGPWQRIAPPPGLLPRPKLGLTLLPSAYTAPKGYEGPEATSGLVTKPRVIDMWSTPRVGNGASGCRVLTERGAKGCLGTQLRFEKSTPTSQRTGVTNPDFAEWMMGFPRGWTALPQK